jgi:exodeoxyribonuclease-5
MLAFSKQMCYNAYKMKNVQLTADQELAQNLIAEWFLNGSELQFVLAGYAGTGKTFLINHVVKNVLRLKAGVEAAFVSPTGKAATVLAQGGTVAGTVHGLIYIRNEDDFDVDENGEVLPSSRSLSFYKRESIDEKIRLIIVDEASMVSEDVLHDLLSYGVKCLFCGDRAQLPPVNGECKLLEHPNVELTQIVRQAEGDPIIQVATMAREGKRIPYGEYGENVSVVPLRRMQGLQRQRILLRADQIICGRNKTRNSLNEEYRSYLGIPREAYLPQDGEKLICTLNNWEKPLEKGGRFYLVNGMIGRVENVREHYDHLVSMAFTADGIGREVQVVADGGVFLTGEYAHMYGDQAVKLVDGTIIHEANRGLLRKLKVVEQETISRFEFAYAITCHKAQGSEFDSVVVFDESWLFGEDRSRWLYTAITRAKKRLLIVR